MPLERIDEEWTTNPNAPPSKASHQPGKPLDDDVPTYRDDKRPLARRGAWKIGEPEISPGGLPTGERIAPFLPKGSRKYAVMTFAAMVALGVFVGGLLKPWLDPLFGLSAPAEVTVLVRSIPSGATVKLDGKKLEGVTPLAADMALEPGDYKVSLSLEGQEPKTSQLSLKEGQTFAQVEATLLEEGEVAVKTRPAGALLLLDGEKVGKAPKKIKVPYDDEHELEIKLAGYQSETVTVRRERPEQHEIKVTLQKKGERGEVVLLSNPTAEVSVDGRLVGQTGLDPLALAYGEHDLTLRVKNLGVEVSYTIDVPTGRTGRYYFDLSAGGQ